MLSKISGYTLMLVTTNKKVITKRNIVWIHGLLFTQPDNIIFIEQRVSTFNTTKAQN